MLKDSPAVFMAKVPTRATGWCSALRERGQGPGLGAGVLDIVPSRDKVEMNTLFTPVYFVWLRIDMHFPEARLPPFLNEIARLNSHS